MPKHNEPQPTNPDDSLTSEPSPPEIFFSSRLADVETRLKEAEREILNIGIGVALLCFALLLLMRSVQYREGIKLEFPKAAP